MRFVSLFIVPVAFLLASCGRNSVYSHQDVVPEEGWDVDSAYSHRVEIADTAVTYAVLINLRHTEAFPSQNLWLFTEIKTPSGGVEHDTIECMLADAHGAWLGHGWGSLREMNILFRQRLKFPEPGTYTFTLRHGMRLDPLPAINDVGVEVLKN